MPHELWTQATDTVRTLWVGKRDEVTAEVVSGGSPWARWWEQTLEAIRGWELADHGVTAAREKEYKALMAPWPDKSFWFLTALVHACCGQCPEHKLASSNA